MGLSTLRACSCSAGWFSYGAIGDKIDAMAKQKYSDDYELISSVDENGREKRETVYRGGYFEISLNENDLRRFRRFCAVLLVAIAFLHIIGGFVDNRGMYQFYVSMPYVLGFLFIFNLGQGIFHLPKEIRQYRRDEIGRSFDQIRIASKLLVIILVIGLLGEIAYIVFFSSQEIIMQEFQYLAVEALAIAAAYLLIRIQQPVNVQILSDPPPKPT